MPRLVTALPKALWKRFKKLSRIKKIIVIILLAIIAVLAFDRFRPKDPSAQYELEAAAYNSITEHVSETGHITTTGAAPVYSTTTGLVDTVNVSNGDYVSKGDVLFKVTATATKQERDAALANYLAAKTALETAQSTQLSLQASMFSAWDSFKDLAESDEYEDADGNPRYVERGVAEFHVSEKTWLAAESAYKKQQDAISQAQANQSATWQAYQATVDSQVIATIDGQIENLGVTVGDRVTAPTALTLSSTSPALVLFSPEVTPTIKLDIGETDIVKVEPGQEAVIEIDAFSNKTFSGTVDRVDTIATLTEGVVDYAVYVAIAGDTVGILGGMTADVDIVVSKKENVLTVPSSAVKPYEGGRAVRVVGSKGEIEFTPVEVGSRGEGLTEIISGIDEGTQVIVALKNEQVQRGPSLF